MTRTRKIVVTLVSVGLCGGLIAAQTRPVSAQITSSASASRAPAAVPRFAPALAGALARSYFAIARAAASPNVQALSNNARLAGGWGKVVGAAYSIAVNSNSLPANVLD